MTSRSRKLMASRSGTVEIQNLADRSRKRRSRSILAGKRMASRSRREEGQNLADMMGLHLVLFRCSYIKKKRCQQSAFSRISKYEEEKEWSGPRNLRSPFPKSMFPTFFGGSCNGLLCVGFLRPSPGRIDAKIVVWEPSTDKIKVIPNPPTTACYCDSKWCHTDVCAKSYGLSCDSESQDYKLVSFTRNFYYNERRIEGELFEDSDHYVSSHVQVYSFKKNSWKELYYYALGILDFPIEREGICVNGFCYWLMPRHRILSFNVVTEVLDLFTYPSIHEQDNYSPIMAELDGSLCLVFYPKEEKKKEKESVGEIQGAVIPEGVISFWVYISSTSTSTTWTRKEYFDLDHSALGLDGFHKPLWFGKKNKNMNGYSLLLQGSNGALLEYDYATQLIHQIDHQPDATQLIFPYVEPKTKANANVWHMST